MTPEAVPFWPATSAIDGTLVTRDPVSRFIIPLEGDRQESFERHTREPRLAMLLFPEEWADAWHSDDSGEAFRGMTERAREWANGQGLKFGLRLREHMKSPNPAMVEAGYVMANRSATR